ncbi:hypothetical protein [Vibrio agarivorans]|uniref:Dodecin domain-containing protein n=1 Tax=Vibrio agarivorans TaxID=153622 RepID=A0ABT7Y791_9VIBR|nr:hypothetical protein [Vibrio agarivorans]MDN2483856.1 hypothetical protein [Vibrio agarivorans]
MGIEFLGVGRAAHGETAAHKVVASSFDEAARLVAKEILEEQHPDWNDDIYVDIVTNAKFELKGDYAFEIKDLVD